MPFELALNGKIGLNSYTNSSPSTGDIWLDSTSGELMAVDVSNDKHALSIGLGYLNGAVDAVTDGNTQTYAKFFRTGATWTGSPYSGTNGDNQGYLLNLLAGSSLYGTQLFLGQDGWNQGEAKVRCLNNGTWGDWQNIFISKDGANGVLPLRTATNSSPTTGDVWLDSTSGAVEIASPISASGTSSTINSKHIVNRLSKTITLENPTAADTIPIFRTDKAITIDKISYEIIGSTNCVFDIEWGNNAGGAGTVVTSSPMTANATQAETTTFSDATISANNYLQLDVNSISGTPDYITVTIHYTMDAND